MAIEEDACLYFNEKGRFYSFTNYYQVSTGWIDYMLRYLGFRIIDVEYVEHVQKKFDEKHVARIALTCILEKQPILEADDEWGKLQLAYRELAEYAGLDELGFESQASRVSKKSIGNEFIRNGLESVNLTTYIKASKPLPRIQEDCVLRLNDRL